MLLFAFDIFLKLLTIDKDTHRQEFGNFFSDQESNENCTCIVQPQTSSIIFLLTTGKRIRTHDVAIFRTAVNATAKGPNCPSCVLSSTASNTKGLSTRVTRCWN